VVVGCQSFPTGCEPSWGSGFALLCPSIATGLPLAMPVKADANVSDSSSEEASDKERRAVQGHGYRAVRSQTRQKQHERRLFAQVNSQPDILWQVMLFYKTMHEFISLREIIDCSLLAVVEDARLGCGLHVMSCHTIFGATIEFSLCSPTNRVS
jgi:hypothetical protein